MRKEIASLKAELEKPLLKATVNKDLLPENKLITQIVSPLKLVR